MKDSGSIRPGSAAGCGRPDRGRRGQALLEVAALEDPAVVGRAGPDAGEAVGLQLEANRELVGVVGVRLALLADLLLDAELLLDVVAELVGDHVRLREIAGRLEALIELVEEAEVEVDLPVGRTVERAGSAEPSPQPDLTWLLNSTTFARW